RAQADIVAASRHGIPAIAHDECLSGFMAWGATIYPTALAWGATFDPELVEIMAAQVGASLRSVGVHQGLAPVLDVARDYRWGRVEETIGEDPYLVATIGTAYVRGLESAGVVATLKHFVGYSASRAGRNFAPVSAGPREVADILLPPFEMAIRDGRARSVMHAYTEIDGVPGAANNVLLTDLLRDEWGFDGTVVSDYFGVTFLTLQHKVAADESGAAALALWAGIDVELPGVRCYGQPLVNAVDSGLVSEELVDRAARRVLTQKGQLGMLDPNWSPDAPAAQRCEPAGDTSDDVSGSIELDPPQSRAVARQLAEESVVLLANDGVLPLRRGTRLALVGPRADDAFAMLGCYTFPSHVGLQYPKWPLGLSIPTLLEATRKELPDVELTFAAGCDVDGADVDGFAAAVAAASAADVCVVALGDRAGLFGRGTSGEGCDAATLELPGVQGELLDAIIATGRPVVLVMVSGRPYALGAYVDRLAAVVQSFFPGEEGGPALAGVLSGRVNPSGRLPVCVPRSPAGQPGTYLTSALGLRSGVSTVDPTPLWPFGHGLSYTSFQWDDVQVDGNAVTQADRVDSTTDGAVRVSLTVSNTGRRAGTDVVQLYLHDPVGQVTRPDVRLIGYTRVDVDPGQSRRVSFDVSADLSSFTGLAGVRIVEPGDLQLRLSTSSSESRHIVNIRLLGPERAVGLSRRMVADVTVE
ncbi:MAG TPA: glycoside hydrolase family 3 N-terminal domain-containing protein, partial [Acidothermaceae bacterium]|nr:glycoside hydrolase family 3 N-terminal domain-containing protein [Acidothermaceae bacterium]